MGMACEKQTKNRKFISKILIGYGTDIGPYHESGCQWYQTSTRIPCDLLSYTVKKYSGFNHQ